MSEEKFRLPISSYGELVKIIQAYGTSSKPLSLNDVTQLAASGRTTISGNNAFLVALGIIEGNSTKSITKLGKPLALALNLDMKDEIRVHWKNIIEPIDFFQKIIAAVRIRKGMDLATLQAHIIYTAGQTKGKEAITGSTTIIQILTEAALLFERDGKIILNSTTHVEDKKDEPPLKLTINQDGDPTEDAKIAQSSVNITDAIAPQHNQPLGITTNINIQVDVQCTIDDIDLLGEKLSNLLTKLSIGANAETKKE